MVIAIFSVSMGLPQLSSAVPPPKSSYFLPCLLITPVSIAINVQVTGNSSKEVPLCPPAFSTKSTVSV